MKKVIIQKYLKRISALLLLLCLILPMAKCTGRIRLTVNNSNQVTKSDTVKKQEANKDVIYVLSGFRLGDVDSWLLLLAFTWPLILILLSALFKNVKVLVFLKILSFFLCLLTGWCIIFLIIFKKPLIGAYVSVTAVILYMFSLLSDLYFFSLKFRFKR